MSEKDLEESPRVAYGVEVTPQEIRAFIDKYAEFDEDNAVFLSSALTELRDATHTAKMDAGQRAAARIEADDADGPDASDQERIEAEQARERASKGNRGGPGRPRSTKK